MKYKKLSILILGLIVLGLLTSCVNREYFPDNGKYNVVATTTLVGDLVANIGGDKVNIISLMGPGVDPHLYKASAGDVTKMQKADMVVYNGLHLEGKMGELFEQIEDIDKYTITVSNGLDEAKLLDFITNPGNFDPHIWFDVELWKDGAIEVNKGLKNMDPANSKSYDENLEAYLLELDELNDYIHTRIEEIPEDKRILITAHDAFSYFGRAYGFQVKGLQGISTSSEAGTKDVRNLAEFIVEKEIKSIFIESSVPRKSIEALQEAVRAKGFNVEIGGELYSDSTGDASDGADTYIGTFKANIDTIVDGLK